MSELLKRIEEAREELHQLVERYGIHAPQVVEQSQRLDGLLGIFNTIYKKSVNRLPSQPDLYIRKPRQSAEDVNIKGYNDMIKQEEL